MKKECGKDAVKDEKLYYFGGWLKNLIFKGASQKNNIEGALAKKRGLGQFADLTREEGGGEGGGLGKKEGWCFSGERLIPKSTLWNIYPSNHDQWNVDWRKWDETWIIKSIM